jgi:hypothetical protein
MRIITKNKNKRDCGIVAAFNAAVWLNSPKPYKYVEKLAKSCGYNPERGIYDFQFSHLLKKLDIPAKKIKPKSMDSLAKKVYVGKCLVLLYTQTGVSTGHAVTVFMDHKGMIRIFNPLGELKNWGQIATDIKKHGMKDFNVYEINRRTKRYDVARAA